MLSYCVPRKYYFHLMKFVLDPRAKESSMKAHVHSHGLIINNIPHLALTSPGFLVVIFFSLSLPSGTKMFIYYMYLIRMALWARKSIPYRTGWYGWNSSYRSMNRYRNTFKMYCLRYRPYRSIPNISTRKEKFGRYKN